MNELNKTVRFVEHVGIIYRVLIKEENGFWLISYNKPERPFFISYENKNKYKRIPVPNDFTEEKPQGKLWLIQDLLDNPVSITDKRIRVNIARNIAERYHTTDKRILRLYYNYLATGKLYLSRKKKKTENKTFNWAIKTFYFSSAKMSLKGAYEMMLVKKFVDKDGNLLPNVPSWSQFRHYFYRNNFHKNPQRIIAREGLTYYQRNCRPIFGTNTNWYPNPGCYQMDATLADIYLVSENDSAVIEGRPYIYIAVDTATQLIAGIYVGFSCDESAVISCIMQAAEDKVEYCRSYNIEIEAAQWPNHGLPQDVVTDKGREFTGSRMMELCRRYGIEAQALPPFRPDRKGIVEKSFDLLQSKYKPFLRGKGIIESDSQERWSVDYRSQATLDLFKFTQVLIHIIIYLNSGRALSDGRTAAQHWIDAKPLLMEIPKEELYIQTLPRKTGVKLGRKGIRINNSFYIPESVDKLCIGNAYTIAYDTKKTDTIYIILSDENIPCFVRRAIVNATQNKINETEASVKMHQMIKNIIS